jgi:hypothetical protein
MDEEEWKAEAGIAVSRQGCRDRDSDQDEQRENKGDDMDVDKVSGRYWGDVGQVGWEGEGRTERVWDDITGKKMDWDMVVAWPRIGQISCLP